MDIWTTAQMQKSNGGRGRRKNSNGQSSYGIKKLRELILELAVRGKLVPQDPNDEPASVLMEKIAKEKKRLVKESKIKKQKSLPEISEDEKPFELPVGWEWVRLGSIGDWGAGSTPDRKKLHYYGGNMPWLKSGELRDNEHLSSSEETVTNDALKSCSLRVCHPGDVLIAMYGATIGMLAILENTATTNQAVCACTCHSGIFNRYLFVMLRAWRPRFTGQGAGGAQPNISKVKILNTIAPLPPLDEQHRIVAKVDELMAICDQLEQQQTDSNATHQTLVETLLANFTNAADQKECAKTWQRIANHFDTLFTTEQSIDQLKQTILKLAVMGKLVPQDPNDEPASVLLKKIAKEKERLIKEGKVKKGRRLPQINTDATRFELPQGWSWARFSEIGEFGRGKSKHRPRNDPSLYSNGKYRMVQTGDVARANGIVKTYTALYNDNGLSQSRLWPKGTMCITIAANIADSGILGFDACFPDSVVGLIPSAEIGNAMYFEYFMRTAKGYLMDFAPSTAQKNINLGILETVYIPLPPAEEIKRIVAKVDELMALCDTLKSRLDDAQTTQVQLADAIVDHAVA